MTGAFPPLVTLTLTLTLTLALALALALGAAAAAAASLASPLATTGWQSSPLASCRRMDTKKPRLHDGKRGLWGWSV